MLFNVSTRYDVEFLDDSSENWGNKITRHMIASGTVESDNEIEVKEAVERAIRNRHTPCWSLTIKEMSIEAK